jgi:large subunit ribosomal protein L10
MIAQVTATKHQKSYPKKKRIMYQNLQELPKNYAVIALSKITKVRATQLMTIRRKLRNNIKIVIIKNKVAQRALEKVTDVRGLEDLSKELEGQCALMFTDISPFKLNLILNKNKVSLPAKAGDVATKEIIIPAGNTGITPGPVLSEFKEANIPTRIEQGSIWVTKDTIVAQSGTVISLKLASLMSKLNIKPIEAGIAIYSAVAEGLFFKENEIKIDLMEYRDVIEKSFRNAIAISIQAGYPTAETVKALILTAQYNATALAVASQYLSTDSIGYIIAKAQTNAQILADIAKKNGYFPQ